MTSTSKSGKARRTLDIGWATVLAAVILAVSGVIGGVIGRATATAPGKSQPHNAPSVSDLSQAKSHITFQDPQPGDHVKQCPRVDGYGQIPASEGLWIIVVPNTAEQPKQYWIESPAKMDGPDHWSAADPVSIDAPKANGVNADIYAVLMDKRWSNYFAGSSAEGNFSASKLPPSTSVIAGPVTVTRIAEPTGRSCRSVNA